MKLPQPLLDSLFFQFTSLDEMGRAMAQFWEPEEAAEAKRLVDHGLPPITSVMALATMLGVNPGLVWSMRHRPQRYYRYFSIPKGNARRYIDAPRVLLKIIQKWVSVHLERAYAPPAHVYGFVSGRSHIDAAAVHCGARWVFSADIQDFFPSTRSTQVFQALNKLGFDLQSADLLSQLMCLRQALAQGAPTSPVVSNLCMAEVDGELAGLASRHGLRLTRYADDIVFSGSADAPVNLEDEVRAIFALTPWVLADKKVSLDVAPARLKVHGLLVHGDVVRLTKGYRNKIRAYQHLMDQGLVKQEDVARVRGHLEYSKLVDRVADASRDGPQP